MGNRVEHSFYAVAHLHPLHPGSRKGESACAYNYFLHPTRLRDCPEAGGRAPLDKPAKQRLIYQLLIYLYRIDEAACFREQR